ncbi:MAG: sulfoxide reductase heme-binding subunit YedZ [Magnetococcales bacterium]|nr:sulfoxide reductase heme-binding subunit YedZ [Magnetococcales bacterium]
MVQIALTLPVVAIIVAAVLGWLGANPIEAVIHETGQWALWLLVVTIALTPLAWITRWKGVLALRRVVGLAAFWYALLHLSAYVGLDQFFDLDAIATDIVKRPYITGGMLAFSLLLVMALTSSARFRRWTGIRNWKRLHQRLIHPALVIAMVHYGLRIKADFTDWRVVATTLGSVWLLRLGIHYFQNRPTRDRADHGSH